VRLEAIEQHAAFLQERVIELFVFNQQTYGMALRHPVFGQSTEAVPKPRTVDFTKITDL